VSAISRDSDVVELDAPPRFAFGERVASRFVVRNDGTYRGRDIGDVLVRRGDVGYVSSIGTFLQQYYIYAVDFVDSGCVVGMKGREIVSLDHLPPELIERLGDAALERLRQLVPGRTTAVEEDHV
jgi:nitrogen fixation protein NifZ